MTIRSQFVNQLRSQSLAATIQPALRHHLRFGRCVIAVLICVVLTAGGSGLSADEISWNTGDGLFFDGNNWNPIGVPQDDDIVRIGNLPGTAGSMVLMGGVGTIVYDGLHLSNGVTLDMNGSELLSFDEAFITGNNTRLIARPAASINEHDFQGELQLGAGAHLELRDNVSVVLFSPSESAGTISGWGRLITNAFNNNGIIRPSNNGVLILDAGQIEQNLTVDLDGNSGTGTMQLTNLFSQLQVNAGSLTDSFSSSITMAPGALLDMNILNGWTADANSLISVSGINNAATSDIDGSHLTFRGTMSVGLAQGKLRVVAPITIESTASVDVGQTDRLDFDGNTTVTGGNFTMGQFAELRFDGPTTLSGGTFNTFSSVPAEGSVNFIGPTVWNGNVTINGIARQNNHATVSGATVINADVFDMDGLVGSINWDITSGLTVNAVQICLAANNSFDGTFNIANGILPRLTVNLDDPTTFWIMNGEMFVSNNLPFQSTKVSGSRMRVAGDLNVNGANVRITADTDFADGSNTVFETANSSLVMRGRTTIEAGALFMGEGTFINGTNGTLQLAGGASLNEFALRNQGLLEIGDATGIADVASFESTADARWQVEIGGHVAGDEHDVLLVGNGDAILAGRLSVKLIDAGNGLFIPEVGDEFTILSTVDSVVGQFENAPISIADGTGYQWEVLYNSNDVTLRLDSTIPNLVLGDVNGDGNVNLLDVSPFVNAVTSGTYIIQADINCDGAVDLLDVSLFVDLLTS